MDSHWESLEDLIPEPNWKKIQNSKISEADRRNETINTMAGKRIYHSLDQNTDFYKLFWNPYFKLILECCKLM